MNVLRIETSCDETSIAVLKFTPQQIKLASHLISSQVKLHAPWGGVVPELAARRHTEVIIPLLDETLKRAHITPKSIDLIAVTAGPGLITALQVGVETAKTLALVWRKPLIAVNHIAGHLVSPFLNTTLASWSAEADFTRWPVVALVVSGGHTELHLMPALGKHKLIGRTLDDAAGEAFDKAAKLLKLPYPGGPQVAMLARSGNPTAFAFPRPLIKAKNFDFSFAGLKTAVLYTFQKSKPSAISYQLNANICASFQAAAVEVLIHKTLRAAQTHRARAVFVTGGVSANQELRRQFKAEIKRQRLGFTLLFPDRAFTGDNAAMIALAGAIEANNRGLKPYKNGWRKLQAQANWELWNE